MIITEVSFHDDEFDAYLIANTVEIRSVDDVLLSFDKQVADSMSETVLLMIVAAYQKGQDDGYIHGARDTKATIRKALGVDDE